MSSIVLKRKIFFEKSNNKSNFNGQSEPFMTPKLTKNIQFEKYLFNKSY